MRCTVLPSLQEVLTSNHDPSPPVTTTPTNDPTSDIAALDELGPTYIVPIQYARWTEPRFFPVYYLGVVGAVWSTYMTTPFNVHTRDRPIPIEVISWL
jgi:hypothetical protein